MYLSRYLYTLYTLLVEFDHMHEEQKSVLMHPNFSHFYSNSQGINCDKSGD